MLRTHLYNQDRRHSALNGYLSILHSKRPEKRGGRSAATSVPQPSNDQEEKTVVNTLSFIVADDDSAFLDTLASQLEDHGFQVKKAGDYFRLSMLLRTNPPDVLLLDYYLPNISGIEIAKELRGDEKYSDTAVILVSGHSQAKLLANHYDLPFLEKPFSVRELLSVLRKERARVATGDRKAGAPTSLSDGRKETVSKRDTIPSLFDKRLLSDVKTLLFMDLG